MTEMTPETTLAVALLMLLLGVGVVFLFWRRNSHNTQVRKEHLERLNHEADEWVARVNRGITPISTRLILKNDEHAILEEGSKLFESRAYRVYGGGGTRIGRVYVGGGVSESHQRVREIDQGTLTLTTKRLIFDGTHENRNVQLSQVLSVSPWSDAIEISTARRAKSQIYTVANPLIWTAGVKALAAGEFSERRTTDNT
jgi:hypothetical protein